MEKGKQVKDLLVIYKDDIISSVVSVTIVAFLLLGYKFISNHFIGALWIGVAFPIAVSLLVLMIRAGFAVLESLFLVSAELSLLIFLSQSYCNIPIRSVASDLALRNLLIIGMMYMILKSFGSLRGALKSNFANIKKRKRLMHEIVVMASFLLFTVLMIWQIYMVMNPIINNLCIFR
jgi:hypothetical protein